MHHHPHWIRIATAGLLSLALSACVRSASNVMTPLPSVPPPTATGAPDSVTPPPTEPMTAAAASPTRKMPAPTETPQVETATATKASLSTEAACGEALTTRLRLGSYAYVNPDPPLPNNLRSEAGEDNTLIGDIQPGQAMKILDGPKCVGGGNWWQVSPLGTDLVGWTAEGDEQNYWLVPCASENECGTQ